MSITQNLNNAWTCIASDVMADNNSGSGNCTKTEYPISLSERLIWSREMVIHKGIITEYHSVAQNNGHQHVMVYHAAY